MHVSQTTDFLYCCYYSYFAFPGYLMEEPNTLEFEEDEETTADSDESTESASDANTGDESLSDEMTFSSLLQSKEIINNSNEEDSEEDSEDDDWDPSQDNPKRRKRTEKDKQKKKNPKKIQSEKTGRKQAKQSEQKQGCVNSASNVVSAGHENDIADGDVCDESWTPEETVETKVKKKKLKIKKKKQTDSGESTEIKTETPQKKVKKKMEENKKKNEREESGSVGDDDMDSLNNVSSTANDTLDSTIESEKKAHGKHANLGVQESPAAKRNQFQATEVL